MEKYSHSKTKKMSNKRATSDFYYEQWKMVDHIIHGRDSTAARWSIKHTATIVVTSVWCAFINPGIEEDAVEK